MPPYFEFGVFYAVVRSWACISVPISFFTAKGAMFAKTAVKCFYFGHKGIYDNRALGMACNRLLRWHMTDAWRMVGILP